MFGDEERSHANVTTAASSSKAEQTRIMKPQIGSRPGFGFMFWTLDFLTAIQFRAEPRPFLKRRFRELPHLG